MLGSFFFLLLLMLIGFLVGGILIYAYRNQIGDYVMKELYTSLNSSYGRADRKEVTETWDFMQKVFSCCGVYGDVNSSTSWAFYRTTLWFLNQTETSMKKYVPDSCCLSMMGDNLTRCVGGMGYEHIAPARGPPVYPAIENGIMFTEGCYSAFIAFLSDNIKVVGGVCVGVAVLMVLAMTFALCLCRRIKDDYLFD
ncbi:tetraspanin-11-like [Pomacea canaliculata]|uniref:tetraspanin-11-like n=1 Tax=Pomacea canaliculata TaxID=400727 RepID=UPI000D72C703|nr:tetraspanin-11-like [Pomacea canaliculata]XP_025108062.1 tetraspanin-11-like [Pomacea canaliculata]XP_025108064.1 tetraspanin-11-like [Pomacea canaliculata]